MTTINNLPVSGFDVYPASSLWTPSNAAYEDKSYFFLEFSYVREPTGTIPQEVTDLVNDTLPWEFILTSFNEVHNDSYDLHNTLADSYTVHTMGAMPIQITMSGYLPLTQGCDRRLDFMYLYANVLRGPMAHKYAIDIIFDFCNSEFDRIINIQTFTTTQSSNMDDMVQFSLTGVAVDG